MQRLLIVSKFESNLYQYSDGHHSSFLQKKDGSYAGGCCLGINNKVHHWTMQTEKACIAYSGCPMPPAAPRIATLNPLEAPRALVFSIFRKSWFKKE